MRVRRGKAYYARKVTKAVHLRFYRRHDKPGARGSELKKALGPDYLRVLKVLDGFLRPLDLQVRQVFELPEPSAISSISEVPEVPGEGAGEARRSPDEARYYVALRGTLEPTELKYCGWRIDDIAALAISMATLVARGGRAPRSDIEELLRKKLPDWRVRTGLDRFVRMGYLGQDEEGMLYLDWRSFAEVDLKKLLDILLRYGG